MSNKNEDKKIVFRYEKKADYKVIYANGIHGGISPRGEFKFDLFTEYSKFPDEVIHSKVPDGIGPEIDRNPKNLPIIREAQVGIIMSVESAKSIARWIMQHINDYEKLHREATK